MAEDGAQALFNDTWLLSTGENPSWELADVMGDVPVARWRHTATLLPDNASLLVFGGLAKCAHARGEVFDVFVDKAKKDFTSWSEIVPELSYDSATTTMSLVTVPTMETVAVSFWIDNLLPNKHAAMLVGSAGCGKTALINGKLRVLSDDFASETVNINYYTNSNMFQKIIEAPLEKKAGKNYGGTTVHPVPLMRRPKSARSTFSPALPTAGPTGRGLPARLLWFMVVWPAPARAATASGVSGP